MSVRPIQRLGFGVLLCVLTLVMASGTTNAAIVVFSGFDNAAGAPGVNATAAAASFDTAAALLGPVNLIDFESAPLGAVNNLNAAPGVTVNGVNFSNAAQLIRNTSGCSLALCGSNTTSGGSQFLEHYGGSSTFTFATPIEAFGAYFGGLQIQGIQILFNDGSDQTVPIPAGSGGFAFVGFTDAGASISSIKIESLNDIISVDDVRYVGGGGGEVPEPATFGLLGASLIGLAALRGYHR